MIFDAVDTNHCIWHILNVHKTSIDVTWYVDVKRPPWWQLGLARAEKAFQRSFLLPPLLSLRIAADISEHCRIHRMSAGRRWGLFRSCHSARLYSLRLWDAVIVDQGIICAPCPVPTVLTLPLTNPDENLKRIAARKGFNLISVFAVECLTRICGEQACLIRF